MAVLATSDILNLNISKVIESIKLFVPLPHRLEYIGKYDKVDYYDDSISTIPESCISAMDAIENVDTIIIGGKDRGIDYTKLIDYLNSHDIANIICMPNTGHLVADQSNNTKCIKVSNLEEAVKIAKKVTKKGKACVLSPAASSYGFFKNFVERGNEFQRLVKDQN
jgi:UDP-N-acetylmuramoylalanine--D-glutamate ligase